MNFDQPDLGIHFVLPTYPLWGVVADYETKLRATIPEKGATDYEYAGLVVAAAAESGLIEEWHCDRQPGVLPNEVRKLDLLAVWWASSQIQHYMLLMKTLDPKALWTWLTTSELPTPTAPAEAPRPS